MSHLQRKTGAGEGLAATPAPVGSQHTRINTDSGSPEPSVQSRVYFHCTPGAPALQSPAHRAAWEALRRRAERLMREDEERWGEHWCVWLSVVYARNGWAWREGPGVRDE